jgi:hypothetical protein
MSIRTLTLVALGGVMTSGCPRHAWMKDESERITAVTEMDTCGAEEEPAAPVAMESAPPLAAGAGKDANYQIRSFGEHRKKVRLRMKKTSLTLGERQRSSHPPQ